MRRSVERLPGNSAGEALDMAQKSEVKFCKVFCIRCAYSVACVCESVIQTFGKTVEKEYYDQVKLKAAVPEEFAEKFKEEITDKTNGKIEMEEVSLPEKIDYVANKVKKKKRCSFKQLLEEQSSKMEVIVSFLAVLELIKIGQIEVHQERTFDDIYIDSIE